MLASTATQFQTFGAPHLAAMGIIAGVSAALGLGARRAESARLNRTIRWSIALVLLGNELVHSAVGLWTVSPGQFARHFLPLHVCGLAVFLVAWVMIRPNRWVFEITYYWVLTGTVQAILTPNLSAGWPSYWFVAFFLTHGASVAGVVFALAAMGMRPGQWSILRVFIFTNAWLVLVGLADWLLGANYMFLRQPPAGATPLFFPPWPWYILFLEAFGVAMGLLLYLPFWPGNRRRAKSYQAHKASL